MGSDRHQKAQTRAQWLRRMLCSGGVDPKLFASLKDEFARRNRNSMFILSILGIFEGIMLLSGDLLNSEFAPALTLYIALLIGSIGFCFISRSKILRKPNQVLICCFAVLFITMLYGLGIAFHNPAPIDYPAVTFMVLFVAVPLMFTDVAWHVILFQAIWACIFIFLSFQLSSPSVFQSNLLDAVTFTMLGAVLYCTISNEHVRQVVDHIKLESETEHLNIIQNAVLMRLSNVIEGRDEDTGGHVLRTCAFVGDLLEDLREDPSWNSRLSDSFIRYSVACASLHDMGKLRIPDAILNKPGRLTPEEFEVMKLHTIYGEELIRRTLEGLVKPEELTIACNIVRSHHERWDGNGYPDGLAGEEIPIEARAMALADVFDALTHERCYKKALPIDEALKIIEEGRGTQFDPDMTDAFVARRRKEGLNISDERMESLNYLQFDDLTD